MLAGDQKTAVADHASDRSERGAADQEMLRRACEGDRSAFRTLVDRYRGPLYAYILRMVHRPSVAEELVQETFVRVYRAAPRYQPTAAVSTWLFRIASRLAMNEASRVHHSLDTPLQELPPDAPSLRSSAPDPQQALERKALARTLEDALARLPPNQRAAVLLARVEELSYSEIAQILEISVGAVDGLLHRARQNLAKLLRPLL